MKVMITRPLPQAEQLAMQLAKHGIDSIIFPTINIEPIIDDPIVMQHAKKLSSYHAVIFISVHAVENAFHYVTAADLSAVTVLAIGEATAKALSNHGVTVDIVAPPPYNSEALLTVRALQYLAEKRILIVRGRGGRQFLADQLMCRGAVVSYAEVYQRLCPKTDATMALSQLPDYISITSNTNLQYLYEMTPIAQRQHLLRIPLLVSSQRAAVFASELGFQQPAVLASSASIDAVVEALLDSITLS